MMVRFAASLLLLGTLLPFTALAQAEKEFGDYIVHYSAFTADVLHPEVARNYGIQRSPSRGVLNIVVMRKQGETNRPVKADVSASAVNLSEQLKRFRMREVTEGDAIYYLADFPVAHKEVLDFDVKVKPRDTRRELGVEFRQQFFTQKPPE